MLYVAVEWAASATATSTGCTRNAVGSNTLQKTLITDVHGTGNCTPLGWQTPQREVQSDKLEVVASFFYRHALSSCGCELSTTTLVKTAWKKFKELLPVLSLLCWGLTTNPCGSFYVVSEREGEKRRDNRGDEREEQGRKRNRNESEETEEIKTFPQYPYLLKG